MVIRIEKREVEIKTKNKGIIFSFKKEGQLPLFMVIKEYFDENGEIEFAEVLLEIEGKECKKALAEIEKIDREEEKE